MRHSTDVSSLKDYLSICAEQRGLVKHGQCSHGVEGSFRDILRFLSQAVGLDRPCWEHTYKQGNKWIIPASVITEHDAVLRQKQQVELKHNFAEHVPVANVEIAGYEVEIDVAALIELNSELNYDVEGIQDSGRVLTFDEGLCRDVLLVSGYRQKLSVVAVVGW